MPGLLHCIQNTKTWETVWGRELGNRFRIFSFTHIRQVIEGSYENVESENSEEIWKDNDFHAATPREKNILSNPAVSP